MKVCLASPSVTFHTHPPRCRPCICPARHVVIGKYFYRIYIAS